MNSIEELLTRADFWLFYKLVFEIKQFGSKLERDFLKKEISDPSLLYKTLLDIDSHIINDFLEKFDKKMGDYIYPSEGLKKLYSLGFDDISTFSSLPFIDPSELAEFDLINIVKDKLLVNDIDENYPIGQTDNGIYYPRSPYSNASSFKECLYAIDTNLNRGNPIKNQTFHDWFVPWANMICEANDKAYDKYQEILKHEEDEALDEIEEKDFSSNERCICKLYAVVDSLFDGTSDTFYESHDLYHKYKIDSKVFEDELANLDTIIINADKTIVVKVTDLSYKEIFEKLQDYNIKYSVDDIMLENSILTFELD